MSIFRVIIMLAIFTLSGCTSIQRLAHVYSGRAPEANNFRYKDGGVGIFYSFTIGDNPRPDTLVFFYGGSGCPSWKYVMPDYTDGIDVPARVIVLNKRFVSDQSTGMFWCGDEFHLANNPEQWVSDYIEFILSQLRSLDEHPKNVLLVGVSEGGDVAARVAGIIPEVTHLAVIGSGGYSMRKSLAILKEKGAIWFDVDAGWAKIAEDPRSLEKSWFGNRYRWWSDVMDINPLAYYLKLNIPIIVGIGAEDKSVPVESALFLEAMFKEAGKHNLTLKVFPSADHRLEANGVNHRRDFLGEVSRLLKKENGTDKTVLLVNQLEIDLSGF